MCNTLLSIRTLTNDLDKSKSTIYRWIEQGEFPKPIRLSKGSEDGRGGSVAWLKSDVDAWKEARIAESKKDADRLSKVHIVERQKDADRLSKAQIAKSNSAFGGDV